MDIIILEITYILIKFMNNFLLDENYEGRNELLYKTKQNPNTCYFCPHSTMLHLKEIGGDFKIWLFIHKKRFIERVRIPKMYYEIYV